MMHALAVVLQSLHPRAIFGARASAADIDVLDLIMATTGTGIQEIIVKSVVYLYTAILTALCPPGLYDAPPAKDQLIKVFAGV